MQKLIYSILVIALLHPILPLRISPAIAGKSIPAAFGTATVNLPSPQHLCNLGNSENESFFRSTIEQMYSSFAKLLAVWVNCDQQKQMASGSLNTYLTEYMLVIGIMSGSPLAERVFSGISPSQYRSKLLEGDIDIDMSKIEAKANDLLDKELEKVLNYKNTIKISGPINLGVLAVSDSVHTGFVQEVVDESIGKSMLQGIVTSSVLVNEVPINFFLYDSYKDRGTIDYLLRRAKKYSAQLVLSN